MKIKNKITFINTAAFFLILVGFSFFLYVQVRGMIIENIDSDLKEKTESIKTLLNTASETSIKTHLRTIAEKNRELMKMYYERYQKEQLTEEEAYNRVKEILLDPDYGKIGKTGYLAGVDTDGVLAIHPLSEGVDASGFEFMQQAVQQKNGYLEYMWKNKGEEEERAKAGWLAYFEPWNIMVWASSYKSEFTGLIDPHSFRDAILNIELGESGYPFIIDTKGNVIIHPTMEGSNMYDVRDPDGKYFIREMCDKKEGVVSYQWRNEGEKDSRKKIARFSYIEQFDWIVSTTYYQDEMYSELGTFTLYFIIFIAGALIVVFFLNLLIGNVISKPVNTIITRLNANIDGTIKLNNPIPVTAQDEVGDLGSMFNTFSERVRRVIQGLRGVQETSRSIGDDLAVNSEEVSSTMEQIDGTIRSFKDKTEILDREVQKTNNAVDEMKADVLSISGRIEEQSAAVTQSSSSIANLIDTLTNLSAIAKEKQVQLENLTDIATKNEKELDNTVSSIQEIAESATSIFDMVKIINQIAAQTNLLAMNAAIEAAHAGDAGRGFAVVAEEIRNLAETTSGNTKNISNSIKTILEKIENTKKISENTGKDFHNMRDDIVAVTKSLGELLDGMNQMSAGSDQVNTGMRTISSITEEVNGSSKAIEEKINDVFESMNKLSDLSSEHLQAIEEISVGVSQILESVQVLRELGSKNTENIDTIEKEIIQFET